MCKDEPDRIARHERICARNNRRDRHLFNIIACHACCGIKCRELRQDGILCCVSISHGFATQVANLHDVAVFAHEDCFDQRLQVTNDADVFVLFAVPPGLARDRIIHLLQVRHAEFDATVIDEGNELVWACCGLNRRVETVCIRRIRDRGSYIMEQRSRIGRRNSNVLRRCGPPHERGHTKGGGCT